MTTTNAFALMKKQNREIYVDKYTATLQTADFADIYVEKIGHMVAIPTQFYTNMEPREDFCLQFTVRGQGDYFVNNRLYHLTPNTLWLLPKDAYHYYIPDKNDPYEYFWVHFNGKSSQRFLELLGISDEQPVRFQVMNPDIEAAFLRLIMLTKNKENNPFALLAATHTLLKELSLACALQQPSMSRSQNQAIDEAIEYIKAHYFEELYLDDLAKVAKLEKVYFTKKFKVATGLSPIQFLIQYRLSAACRLLKEDFTLQEIAMRCGFSDFTNFLHRFKNFVGMTPSQYKKTFR